MLQELATGTSAALATASLLFFVAVYAFVVVRVIRARKEDLDARARMALDDEPPAADRSPSSQRVNHG
ncbi:MAG: hypothetical protein R2712_02475 [Vicinamibacterales bacterium]